MTEPPARRSGVSMPMALASGRSGTPRRSTRSPASRPTGKKSSMTILIRTRHSSPSRSATWRPTRFGGCSPRTAISNTRPGARTAARSSTTRCPDRTAGSWQIQRVSADDPTATPEILYGDSSHPGYKPTYSPDGSGIVFGCNGNICRMDADGSNVVVLVRGRTRAGTQLPDLGSGVNGRRLTTPPGPSAPPCVAARDPASVESASDRINLVEGEDTMIRSRTSLARTTMTGLAAIAFAACSSGAASSPAPSTVGAGPIRLARLDRRRQRRSRSVSRHQKNRTCRASRSLTDSSPEVARASGGQLAVDVTYNAGTQESGKEQRVASQVIAGDVDLAVVPVRAWSDVGVTSLQALAAPFLIDSDALLETVTTDDTVIEPLLEGMRDQGLIGLAVWPEDLRHPFTFEENGRPLVSPADFKGRTIWAITSGSQQELIEALGATMIDDRSVDPFVADGSLRGAESGLWAGAANLPGPPTATGDVTFYPKIEVIVAEDAVWSRLSPDQQAIVRAAAVAARDLAIADHRTDADLAKAYCAQGGKVALAGPANVAKFMDAAKPIYDRLERRPLTATALAAIRALKSSTPASVSTACKPPVSADGDDPTGRAWTGDRHDPGWDLPAADARRWKTSWPRVWMRRTHATMQARSRWSSKVRG